MSIKAVFFDVDGVLLNTLPAHIQVCVDLAKEKAPHLSIPTKEEFKNNYIRKDKEIAPMKKFFHAVGFRGESLNYAVKQYDDNFSDTYKDLLLPFGGVEDMIADMSKLLPLGIVTSNVRKNIEVPLANCFKNFTPGCIFTEDMGIGKSAALVLGASYLAIKTEEILFVGDQKRDKKAAEDAGARFLGVNYGWQFMPGDKAGCKLVDEPHQIISHTLSLRDI